MKWILGPCAIESEKMYYQAGLELTKIMQGKEWFFKGSFDKANRTSIKGKRGVGMDRGLKVFKEIKDRIPDIKLITDVHEAYQVEKLVPYIDWSPFFHTWELVGKYPSILDRSIPSISKGIMSCVVRFRVPVLQWAAVQ